LSRSFCWAQSARVPRIRAGDGVGTRARQVSPGRPPRAGEGYQPVKMGLASEMESLILLAFDQRESRWPS